MKRVLIIGASVLQMPAILKAKEMGLFVGVADYNPEAVGIPYADEYFNVSTIDEEGIYEAAKEFQADGIITLATDMPMRALAYACGKLNLIGIDYETAKRTTDKALMIKAFEEHKVAHPWFYVLEKGMSINSCFSQVTYPCITKPTDSSGSRGVMIVKDANELEKALAYSSESSRNGDVIIEELLIGREVSVEVIVYKGIPHVIQITDKKTTGAPHFVEAGHSQPGEFDEATNEKIKALAVQAATAVGIKNGAAHVEMMVTANGPKMIEIGARLGGDCITTHLVPLSTGVDMVRAIIDIALGNEPDIEKKYNKCSAIKFIEADFGKISAIKGVEDAKNVEHIINVDFFKSVGDITKEIESSGDRAGYVIARADSLEDAMCACDEAAKKIIIDVEPQKKVLFLGGFPQMIDIVKTAKNMGIFTVVADMDPNSPAKKIADKAFDISTNEIDKLLDLCHKEGINGVFNGFEDFNIHVASKLCAKLNLPFYATAKQIELVTNKDSFKEQCKLHGIDVIEEYTKEEALEKQLYPYIVKPVDSYGSRGITICYSDDELQAAYEKAKDVSKSGNVVIEKYIDSDCGTELFYTIVDGHIHLTATADRHTVRYGKNAVPLPVAEVFPSLYRSEVEEVNIKLKKMLTDLNIVNGLVLVQMLNEKGNFYPYEMAFRFTGEQHYELVREQEGLDLGEMMIKYCLNEEISDYDNKVLDDTCFKKPAINLALLLNPGKIRSIKGLEILDKIPEVIDYIVTHKDGDVVEDRGDYSRILVRANIVAKDRIRLEEIIIEIQKSISVISDNNENMLIEGFKIR